MKPELRNIAHGFSHSVNSFHAYDVNGYRFHTHEYTTNRANRKTINSGVLCEGSDKLHYYGRVEAIYELNYDIDATICCTDLLYQYCCK